MIVEVKDVAVKGTNHIKAVIDVVQKKVKGSVRLTYWGKNKKTKQLKLKVCNISGHEKVFVSTFSKQILKPLMDTVLSGGSTKSFFKSPLNKTVMRKFPCDTCGMNSSTKEQRQMHMNNVHKSDDTETTLAQENKLIATKAVEDMKQMIKDVSKTPIKHMKCEHCNSDFLSKSSMEAHIIDQHRNQQQTNTTSSKRDRMTSELTKSPSTIPPPKKVILEKVQHQGAGKLYIGELK